MGYVVNLSLRHLCIARARELFPIITMPHLIRGLQRREEGVGAVAAVGREDGRGVSARGEPAARDGRLGGAPLVGGK